MNELKIVTFRFVVGATNQMLDNYDCASRKIILMNKDEHMPWMKKKHSEYLDKVECLGIGDKNYLLKTDTMVLVEIDDALDAIEVFVEDFFKNKYKISRFLITLHIYV